MKQQQTKKKSKAFVVSLIACFLAVDFFAFGLFFEISSRSESHKFYDTLKTHAAATATSAVPKIDFKALKTTCPNAVAWIYSAGTPINYPIVQGKDNKYYLSHRADNVSNENGAAFLNNKNSPNFTDDNSVIFAHHLATGDMFTSLVNYRDQSYYEKHKVMYLITPNTTYQVELMAGYTLAGASPMFPTKFEQDGQQKTFLDNARKNSIFKSKVLAAPGEKLLTLVTCSYDFDNARLAVVGKLVKK